MRSIHPPATPSRAPARARNLFLAAFFAGFGLHAQANAELAPAHSVVRFNTVCANCHEGECSGRLSFHHGPEAARGHMQRYLGPISDEDVRFLFAVLRHTKEACGQYPVSAGVPVGEAWTAAELEPWHNPQEGAYFVPLGEVEGGRYRLQMVFAEPAQARLRITDGRFEEVAETSLCADKPAELEVELPAGSYYLTLHCPQPLQTLKLSPEAR